MNSGHYESVTEKLDTTSPVSILVTGPTLNYINHFRDRLLQNYVWDRVESHMLTSKTARVYFVVDGGALFRGLRVDCLAPHNEMGWRMYEALVPCADSVIRY